MEAFQMFQTLSALSGLVCLTMLLLAGKQNLKKQCFCR